MRSLNIAARRFGKTTLCVKRFSEALSKDPLGVGIIIPFLCERDKISYHLKMVNSSFYERYHMMDSISSIRGKYFNKLFIDNYDYLVQFKDYSDDILMTIPYIEAWSTQFLTMDDLKKIEKIQKCRREGLSLKNIEHSKYEKSFITWPNTKL